MIKEVADIAQDGDTAAFTALVKSAPANIVEAFYDSSAPTLPGKTTKFTITANGDRTSLTLLSMLANTNDTIIGLNAIPLPTDTTTQIQMVPAMDAGVEDNDEDCKYIPGPACNNPKKASAKPGEGFLHISNGIHGQGSLSAPIYDWQNPTARIAITKVK